MSPFSFFLSFQLQECLRQSGGSSLFPSGEDTRLRLAPHGRDCTVWLGLASQGPGLENMDSALHIPADWGICFLCWAVMGRWRLPSVTLGVV